MLCTGCGKQTAVVGQFCSSCDERARRGSFERRRPVGGSQWQAFWGIRYGARTDDSKARRWLQGGMALAVVGIAVLLAF